MRKLTLPPYVWRKLDRQGRPKYYFRQTVARTSSTYIRLPDDPNSAAFHGAYAQHLATLHGAHKTSRSPDTIGGLIAAFKASPEFARLAPNTRGYHVTLLDNLAKLAKYKPADLDRRHVIALRDKLRDKPRTADLQVAVIRRLYSFAIDRNLARLNPAAGIGRLDVDPGSYDAWSEDERAQFEQSNPPQYIMTAYMIAAYASPRRADILRLTRADYDGQFLTIRPGKTKRRGTKLLIIPAHERLRAYLDDLPIDVGLLVPHPAGHAWTESTRSTFSKSFRAHCDSIGLTHLHLHGLRHTCATALIEAGCTDEEAQAITGHTTAGMLKRYTKGARQQLLARRAMAKLEGRG